MAKHLDLWLTYAIGAASGLIFPVAAEWLRRVILDSRRLSIRAVWGPHPQYAGGPDGLLCTITNDRVTPVAVDSIELELRRANAHGRPTITSKPLDYFISESSELPARLEQAAILKAAFLKAHMQTWGNGEPFEVRCVVNDATGRRWQSAWVTVEARV